MAIALSVVALALGLAGVVIVNNAATKLNHDPNLLMQPPVVTTPSAPPIVPAAQTPTPQSTTGSVPAGQRS